MSALFRFGRSARRLATAAVRCAAPAKKLYMTLSVKKDHGALVKSGRRTYYTSVAGTTGTATDITKTIDSGTSTPGAKQNFVMIADVGPPSDTAEYLQRSENRMLALEALGIPNERTTFIAPADKLVTAEQRKSFHNFLKFQAKTRGHFQHVLVVRGSDMAMKKKLGGDYESVINHAYSEACAIVNRSHVDRLALIMNLYQPYVALMAEQAMKRRFMAVKYFTSPIFRLSDLPLETLLHLQKEMHRGEHDITFGLLEASIRMYGSASQQIVTPADHRVNQATGRDRYTLPPLKPDGTVDLSYITDALDWAALHHKKPSQAFYTRSGSGHGAELILEAQRGTEFDLTAMWAKWGVSKRALPGPKSPDPKGKDPKKLL